MYIFLDKIQDYFKNVKEGPLHKEIQRIYQNPAFKVGSFFLLNNRCDCCISRFKA